MSLFTINEATCTRCNICVDECPAQIIEAATKECLPAPTKEADTFCINCGHCVAVCPTEAFNLATMNSADCTPINRELLPDENNIAALLKSRRSVRKFTDQPVGHEVLADLLDVSRYAPTGSNAQQVHWTVFQNAEDIKSFSSLVVDWAKLMADQVPDAVMAERLTRISSEWAEGRDPILHKAPCLIVVHGHADLPCIQTDCSIALTYLELYAASKGLGTYWAGFLSIASATHPPVLKALNLPEGHNCFGAVMLGHPRYQYNLIPKREPINVTWR
jgi:nitroreductase/NAD-dependent dihydropyrimidine dehydrogenase PreA subunit